MTTPDADRPTLPAPRDPIVSTRLLDPTTVHPLFEDSFWQELVFDQYDAPGTLDGIYRFYGAISEYESEHLRLVG